MAKTGDIKIDIDTKALEKFSKAAIRATAAGTMLRKTIDEAAKNMKDSFADTEKLVNKINNGEKNMSTLITKKGLVFLGKNGKMIIGEEGMMVEGVEFGFNETILTPQESKKLREIVIDTTSKIEVVNSYEEVCPCCRQRIKDTNRKIIDINNLTRAIKF